MYKDAELDIWNLNYLKYRAHQRLAADKNQKYAVAYMDICQFRRYNTLYGWHAGQKILELMVRVLAENIDSEKEQYARSQGDHFVLFVRYDSLSELEVRLTELEDRITQSIYEMADIRMPVTMGVCCIPRGSDDIQVSISYAIQASDLLKNSYSNEIRIYDERRTMTGKSCWSLSISTRILWHTISQRLISGVSRSWVRRRLCASGIRRTTAQSGRRDILCHILNRREGSQRLTSLSWSVHASC